jgi:hypothetical protein
VQVVVDAPVLEEELRPRRDSNYWPFKNSSRRRPLKLLIQAFSCGQPRSMNTLSAPLKRH